MQIVIDQIAQCKEAANDRELGNGLLALSHLVKWVASDNGQNPFARSDALALEALEAFRKAGDEAGQARALVACYRLDEAEAIAAKLGDENLIAMVTGGRARNAGLSNRAEAAELHGQALDIYRRTGNLRGQANSLFGMAISLGEPAGQYAAAIEAADLYRQLGDRAQAARCVSVAIMYGEAALSLDDLESILKSGLEDAQASTSHQQEGYFYSKLSSVCIAKGQTEEAEKYRRWAQDMKESDGLTPLERWEEDVDMTKWMISTMRAQGNHEAASLMKAELTRLKKAKPRE